MLMAILVMCCDFHTLPCFPPSSLLKKIVSPGDLFAMFLLHSFLIYLLVRRLRRGHRHSRRLQRAGHRDRHVVAASGGRRRRRGRLEDLYGAARSVEDMASGNVGRQAIMMIFILL